MMQRQIVRLLATVLIAVGATSSTALGAGDSVVFKKVAAMNLVAVKVDPQAGYAPAFGDLVQYYLQHPEAKVRFPQMSVGSPPNVYAAIAFDGEAHASGPVRVLHLPAATVAVSAYKGDYAGFPAAVKAAVSELQASGIATDMTKMLRLLYRNSPDNTPPNELVTEIEIPTVPR